MNKLDKPTYRKILSYVQQRLHTEVEELGGPDKLSISEWNTIHDRILAEVLKSQPDVVPQKTDQR